jgi:hypothetical protein
MSTLKLLFFYSFILISFLFSIAACTSKISPPVMIDNGSVQVINHSTSQVATYIKKKEQGLWLCKENFKDAVKTSHAGATLTGLAPGENVHAGESSGAIGLGGMDPEVLITSELLYRACELCANLNADKQLSLQIYKMFLETLNKTAAVQTGTGTKSIYGKAVTTSTVTTSMDSPTTPKPVSAPDSSSVDSDSDSGNDSDD